MGELEDYFRANPGRLLAKWRHYFEIYERHFAPFRGRDILLLEFGVWHGGSLQMWRHYFGPQAHIVGVDSNPAWGGGLGRPGTFIEFVKQLVDQLHAWYGPPPGLKVDYITRMTFALHFYDSMLVLEKRLIDTPRSEYTGKPTRPLASSELQSLARMDQDAGRPEVALALYRKALQLTPEDEALRKLVASLEGGAP